MYWVQFTTEFHRCDNKDRYGPLFYKYSIRVGLLTPAIGIKITVSKFSP